MTPRLRTRARPSRRARGRGGQPDVVWLVGPAEESEATVQAPANGRAAAGAVTAEMLVTLAQELRTPLATLSTMIETIMALPDDRQEDASELMPQLLKGVDWLARLIDNLTSTSLLQSGLLPLRSVPVPMAECVVAASRVLEPLLRQRRHRLVVRCPEPSPDVAGDPLWVGQILLTLLTNACGCSPTGSLIDLSVVSHPGWIEVRVQDQGPGVASGDQVGVFQPYPRARIDDRVGASGLDLGLHIVQTLVQLHGGTVGVRSTPGSGACYWFRLPAIAPSWTAMAT
jgi:signal transduction histidine kinase